MSFFTESYKGFKKGIKDFGEYITILVNTVLLFFAYIIGIGLTFLFAKILRKHFLDLKPSKKEKTYWSDLNLSKKRIDDYYRQF